MPLSMKKGTKRSDVATKLDEEFAQNVFSSWLVPGPDGKPVITLVGTRCRVKLAELTLQSEGIYDVASYMTNADVDEVTAQEAVERSKAAWQKPAALLAALQRFRACLARPGVAGDLAATGHSVDEHREVVEDLIRRVQRAQTAGASAVCLELDAFLL